MPQLVKGGKWVFGWTILGQGREVRVPPEAYLEYGFQERESLVFLRGSRSSGGFILGKRERMDGSILKPRVLAEGWMGEDMLFRLPQSFDFEAGKKFLAVRGSGLALSFLAFGRIYEEGLRHPEIEEFTP